MDEKERTEILNAWVQVAEIMPTASKFDEIVEDNPDQALDMIVELISRELSEIAFYTLAAGPLENILFNHGDKCIERVEQLAKSNERFKELLRGVWQSDMDKNIWERICKARE